MGNLKSVKFAHHTKVEKTGKRPKKEDGANKQGGQNHDFILGMVVYVIEGHLKQQGQPLGGQHTLGTDDDGFLKEKKIGSQHQNDVKGSDPKEYRFWKLEALGVFHGRRVYPKILI